LNSNFDIYERLGVPKIVNASGAKTRLSGSIMPDEVVQAMVQASKELVDMEYLQAKACEVIGQVTGAQAGIVTTGAASGLLLATASCLTGLDIAKMEKLPDTTGMKNEVVIARNHRNAYDHQIRLAGVRLVEAGLDERGLGAGVRSVEAWEIEAAITERTCAIAYSAKPANSPPIEQVIRVGKANGIPVIVDAAGELPPASNLKKFIAMGASAVVFSGGKAIRGPQASGILAGEKDLIMGAALQQLDMDTSFELWNPPSNLIDKSRLKGIPRTGIGRGYKAGKEEIVGLITALRLFADRDEKIEEEGYAKSCKYLVEALGNTDSIKVQNLPQSELRSSPIVEIRFTKAKDLQDMVRIDAKLKERNPPIYLESSRINEKVLQIIPFNLREEDLDIIVERIKEVS
jgi:D-glucosaminate-6-phosphate ammonia-lyase